MFQLTVSRIRLGALLCGGLLVPSLRAAASVEAIAKAPEPETTAAQLLTHIAYIPANSDPGTIRFEGIRLVSVPAGIQHTAGANYCAELASRDPGGSMFCPSASTAQRVTAAYEVTYSFTGQPMTSDELASRHFTLKVYFHPDELAPEVRQAVAGRLNRADTAAYFAVNAYREPKRRNRRFVRAAIGTAFGLTMTKTVRTTFTTRRLLRRLTTSP